MLQSRLPMASDAKVLSKIDETLRAVNLSYGDNYSNILY